MSVYGTGTYGTAVYGSGATVVISSIVVNPSQTSAVITWTTNVVASSQVSYGLTSSYSNSSALQDTSPRVLSHSVTITGLTASTTYHYSVTSVDGSGNSASSTDATFATLAAVGPVITNILTTRTSTTATITWTTDIIASSQVEYGLTVAYGTLTTVTDTSPRVTSHSRTITGLTPATDYHFRVRSIDGSANETISADNIFTTLATTSPAAATRPQLIVEADFTSNATAAPVWTDISRYVRDFSTNRGRQFEFDQFAAGTLSLTLNNQDRRFDPTYTSSPYYPFVLPMRRIRVRAVWNTIVYPIFQGFVESWPQQWQAHGKEAEVQLTATDGFLVFSLAKLNEYHPSELAGNRITSILNSINWGEGQAWVLADSSNGVLGTTTILSPLGGKTIAPGQTTVQATMLTDTGALEHILSVADTENGLFFVNRAGTAVFIDRAARVSPPYNTSQATFGDANNGVELPYADLTFDTSPIWNEVRFQRENGAEQVVQDSVSRAQYYLRTKQQTGLLHTTDSEVNIAASWVLNRYKDPAQRVSGMVLNGTRSPTLLWPQLLGREIGDRITIRRRPPGGGAAIDQDSYIEGISQSGTPTQWTTTFRTSPANLTTYWILGDAVAGLLGTSTRLSY